MVFITQQKNGIIAHSSGFLSRNLTSKRLDNKLLCINLFYQLSLPFCCLLFLFISHKICSFVFLSIQSVLVIPFQIQSIVHLSTVSQTCRVRYPWIKTTCYYIPNKHLTKPRSYFSFVSVVISGKLNFVLKRLLCQN